MFREVSRMRCFSSELTIERTGGLTAIWFGNYIFHTSENGQHDYLRLPELVEDVCNAYFENYAHDLTPHYLKVLHPCIVWFQADIIYEKGTLETALAYAYTSVRNLPPDGNSTFGMGREEISVQVVNC